MSTATPIKPLAGQEALQRRLGLDDDAFNYLFGNACRMADHLRETGALPFGCILTTVMTTCLLGAAPSSRARARTRSPICSPR